MHAQKGWLNGLAVNSLYAFYVLLAVLTVSFWKKRKDGHIYAPKLGADVSTQLKGAAILCVVLGHLSVISFIPLPTLKFMGAQGVAIFLFASGFGLTKSYLKKGINPSFVPSRFMTVLLPYFVATVMWILLDAIIHDQHYPLSVMVTALFGLNLSIDSTMWYITYILIWYVMFYLIFGLKLSNPVKLLLLAGVAILIKYTMVTKFAYGDWAVEYYIHMYLFPLGSIAALYGGRILKLFKLRPAAVFIVVAAAAFIGYYANVLVLADAQGMSDTLRKYIITDGLFTVFLVSLFIFFSGFGWHSRLLKKIGEYSYEIYLCEGIFLRKYDILHVFPSRWVSLALYVAVVGGCAVLLKWTVWLLKNRVPGLIKAVRKKPAEKPDALGA